MPLIKITPADKWFSLCVRERAGWVCEVCGTQYQENSQGLHCSHIYSRRHKSVRLYADNGTSMCMGCHQRLGGNPLEFADWSRRHLGDARIELLKERKNSIFKFTKQDEKEAAAFYKAQYEEMKRKRAEGFQGRLEFKSWI